MRLARKSWTLCCRTFNLFFLRHEETIPHIYYTYTRKQATHLSCLLFLFAHPQSENSCPQTSENLIRKWLLLRLFLIFVSIC